MLAARGLCIILFAVLSIVSATAARGLTLVSKWDRFESSLQSRKSYENPVQAVSVTFTFTSPSGLKTVAPAFWDGGKTWRVRFSPNELGDWTYLTTCSDENNTGLQKQTGAFTCTAPQGKNRFSKHGPVRVSRDGYSLRHEDDTPFFWLADTAWNGPLRSSPKEWREYIDIRRAQGFSAVQWVTTQWRAAPDGNRFRQLAYTGKEVIQINPEFFRELDAKVDALDRAGLLSVPVLLWAHPGQDVPKVSPGFALPEDQQIVLARYMVARWGANNVAWILGGDGDYRRGNAEKWIRIGRAVFAQPNHAPVMMHPGGMHWVLPEFQKEPWFDVVGYQSGHGDDSPTLRWLTGGPPATAWKKAPPRPFINLEPPYEFHIAYQSRQRIAPELVRRTMYWSLLVAPTAGVTYGGHGVWGWDDGTKPPVDHPNTGTPLPLGKALVMPGAEQMRHLAALFNTVQFQKFRPAPMLLRHQPGEKDPARFIAVAQTVDGAETMVYTPEPAKIELTELSLPKNADATWFDPTTGKRTISEPRREGDVLTFQTPAKGDWVLLIRPR